jgi:hypothetical protein
MKKKNIIKCVAVIAIFAGFKVASDGISSKSFELAADPSGSSCNPGDENGPGSASE